MKEKLPRGFSKVLFTLFTLFFIPVSLSHADNPCGVSCTQTIADNAAATAAAAAVNTAISTRLYEKNVIYAETAANIMTGGGSQWAFGDGDTGNIGIPVVEQWELYAVSFQARSVTANTNVVMNVLNINTGATLYSFTVPLTTPVPPATNGVYTTTLTTPVTIPAGATIGFNTGSVSAGVVAGARVGVWLRRRAD